MTASYWEIALAAMHLVIGRFGASLLYYVRFGRNPNVDMRKTEVKSRHRRITEGMGLVYFAWLFVFLIADRTHAQPLVAWTIVALAFIGMLVAQAAMGRAFRIGQDDSAKSDQDELNTKGLFVFSRNPIYVCSFLYMAGATFFAPTPLLLGLLGCFALGVHGLVIEEERFLGRQFGAAYESYKQSTPRYLGFKL